MPRRPRRIDLADASDIARVVIPLRGEVLPHEEIGCAVVDGGAEGGEGLKRDDDEGFVVFGARGARGAGLEPMVRVGEDVAHDI